VGAATKAIANVIGPRAVYRTPRPRRSPQRLPPVEGSVDAAIVEIAKTYPTDGYRMVCAFGRKFGQTARLVLSRPATLPG
jgi:hypothetical protein